MSNAPRRRRTLSLALVGFMAFTGFVLTVPAPASAWCVGLDYQGWVCHRTIHYDESVCYETILNPPVPGVWTRVDQCVPNVEAD